MPLGEGWFLHATTGEIISVHEHATDVIRNPERYGLARSDVAGLSTFEPAEREAIIRKVLANGFIRVRGHRGSWVFEHGWPNRADVLFAVAQFATKLGLGEYATVDVHNVNNAHDQYTVAVKDLLDPEKVGELGGFSVLDHRLLTGLDRLAEALGLPRVQR